MNGIMGPSAGQPTKKIFFGVALPLKMGLICCPETLVNNYKSTLRSVSEKRISCTVFLSEEREREREGIPCEACCFVIRFKFKYLKDPTNISDVPLVCACPQSRNIK
jgi:hypothetical protein